MNKAIKISSLIISLTSVAFLSGCTTPGKNMLPHGDMTMAQIYRAQTGLGIPDDARSEQLDVSRYQINSSSAMLRGDQYMNSEQSKMNSEFKVLPNPNIAAYIFPHMSHYNGTSVPVPGYTTTFFLYEKNHYAMPGENY